jgi:hypothetical protein
LLALWQDFDRKGATVAAISISRHATKRIVQRVKIPKRAVANHVHKALMLGRLAEDYDGAVRNWIEDRVNGEGHADTVIIYNDIAYLFAGFILVTVYEMPDNIKEQYRP